MLPASIAPSAAPAPTIVWSSSTKVITSPLASWISLSTAFRRSSNSPRYLAPATMDPRSSATRRRPRSDSGTSPSTMRCARPSTIAVLPTPGSPISTGLFFVRRDSTWTTRRTSSSRPMTGSSRPSRASAVRSRPYFSSDWKVPSGSAVVILALPRTSRSAGSSASVVVPSTRANARAGRGRPTGSRRRGPHGSSRRARVPHGRSRDSSGDEPPTVRGSAAERRSASDVRPPVASTPAWASSGLGDPLGLGEDRGEQVRGRDLGVPGGRRLLQGVVERLPRPRRPPVRVERHRAARLGVDARAPRPGAAGRGRAGRSGASLRRVRSADAASASSSSRSASSSRSSSRIRRTPSRLWPSLVSCWMRRSCAMSLVGEPSATAPRPRRVRRGRCARSCAASGGACPRAAAATEIT